MTDSDRDSDPQPHTDDDASREHAAPEPFWRKPAFAVVAALIAVIGMVWRCA